MCRDLTLRHGRCTQWCDQLLARYCLSVRPSVTLCIVALSVGVGVESYKVIPILVFLGGHFLFTSSDTFAVGCIVQPQHTVKNLTTEIYTSGIAMCSADT